MNFSEWLADQLQKKRLDRNRAARIFGVSRQSLHNWLTGSVFPSHANLAAIANGIEQCGTETYEEIVLSLAESIANDLKRRKS